VLVVLEQVLRKMGFPILPCASEASGGADSLMAATQREVAVLGAELMGAQSHIGQFGPGDGANRRTRGDRRLFRDLIENTAQPVLILDPRPGLHIVDVNDAYAAMTMTSRRRLAGSKLFDVFPDNPLDPAADGVSKLYESLRRCAQSGRSHRMPVIRYDIRNPAGEFVKRHWQPTNTPIFDDQGRLVFLANNVGGAVEV
jgi:PAS domain-containing protein